jgi:hypothetical protein
MAREDFTDLTVDAARLAFIYPDGGKGGAERKETLKSLQGFLRGISHTPALSCPGRKPKRTRRGRGRPLLRPLQRLDPSRMTEDTGNMEIVLGWIALSVAVGFFASARRGRSGFLWFLIAIITSPLLAFLFVAIMQPTNNAPPPQNLQASVLWYVDYARQRITALAGDLEGLRALDLELQPLAEEIAAGIAKSRYATPSSKLEAVMAEKTANDLLAPVIAVGEDLRQVLLDAGENPARFSQPVHIQR